MKKQANRVSSVKLTLREIRSYIFKKLENNIYDVYTYSTEQYDEYNYHITNSIKIIVFVNIQRDEVNFVKLYQKGKCLMIIYKPDKLLMKIMLKVVYKNIF